MASFQFIYRDYEDKVEDCITLTFDVDESKDSKLEVQVRKFVNFLCAQGIPEEFVIDQLDEQVLEYQEMYGD